jgi:hypothetical protein
MSDEEARRSEGSTRLPTARKEEGQRSEQSTGPTATIEEDAHRMASHGRLRQVKRKSDAAGLLLGCTADEQPRPSTQRGGPRR